jgi:hypothetical protein
MIPVFRRITAFVGKLFPADPTTIPEVEPVPCPSCIRRTTVLRLLGQFHPSMHRMHETLADAIVARVKKVQPTTEAALLRVVHEVFNTQLGELDWYNPVTGDYVRMSLHGAAGGADRYRSLTSALWTRVQSAHVHP